MRKRIGKLCLNLAMLFLCLFAVCFVQNVGADAESYYDEEADTTVIDTNWWFQRADIRMEVGRDKTFRITERLQVGFLKGDKNTGIIRDIQRVSRTTRVIDGKQQQGEKYIATLSDVSVTINGEPAKVTQSLYQDGEFYSIKMQKQDESYFPATDQTLKNYNLFELSYTYGMGDDKMSGYDDFTFDVYGYAMDYTRVVTAEIVFPDEVDASAVSFRTNRKAEWIPDREQGERYSVIGNTVKMAAVPNKEHVGYTVQVLFEEGYFQTAGRQQFGYYYALLALAIAGMAACVALLVSVTARRPVEQVEFYAPQGMSVMRYSAIWHQRARNRDIGAVILYWASKGYVKLHKDGKKDFILQKTGTPSDAYECEYFNAMFRPLFSGYGDDEAYFSTRELRLSSDTAFKRTLSQKAERMRTAGDIPAPCTKWSTAGHILCSVCSLIPMFSLLLFYAILYSSIFPMFFFIFMAAGTMVGALQARNKETPLLYIFPVAFMAMPLFAVFTIFYIPLYDYVGLIYLSLVWWAVMLVLLHLPRRRTEEAQREYGKMRGFKRFLLTAELDRIERLFDENPDYFSDIIPFCLVMDISKKVEKRFAPLNVVMPEWADGISLHGLSSISHTLSSSGCGGSSGGGGGGGSSGGGGGGGGSRGC